MDFFSKLNNFLYENFRIRFTDSEEEQKASFLPFDLYIQSIGYYCEEHIVKTADDVNLVVFRIKGKKKENLSSRKVFKQSVYFQHGFLDSSDSWVCNHEKYNLPIIFVERGFDVWVGNSRGSKYNLRFLEDNKKFNWDFSFEEIGIYDVPACVDYIKKANQASEKLILVGHSFGASAILAGISRNPDFYKEKMLTTILISPITEFQNIQQNSFQNFFDALNIEKILAESPEGQKALLFHDSQKAHFTTKFYNIVPLLREMEYCMNAENTKWTESPTTYKTYFSRFPNGTSKKYVEHIKQIIATGKFVKYTEGFNYSLKENNENNNNNLNENNNNHNNNIIEEYDYDSFANIPTILIYGKADKLNTYVYGQTKIIEKLGENVFFKFLEYDNMGHYCFLLNNDLSWVNFLLKALQQQIYQMENQFGTLDSEANISVNRTQNKSQHLGFGVSKIKEGGAMDYLIN